MMKGVLYMKKLGFGCMRFPLNADGKIDEAEAERMERRTKSQEPRVSVSC